MRAFARRWRSSAFGLLMTIVCGSEAMPRELNVLTWESYTDPAFISKFEASTACRVTSSFVGSADDFTSKLAAGGGVYDIVTPGAEQIALLRRAGFLQPIDITKVPTYDTIYPTLSRNKSLIADGSTWAVPLIWAYYAIIYRTDKFASPPTSAAVLFDSAYKGKISLWDDMSELYLTARLLGYHDIYNLSDDQLEAVENKLIEEKHIIRKYWTSAGELSQLIADQEVYVSNSWAGMSLKQVNSLDKGFTVAEITPKELAQGASDNLALVKGTPNEDCAYKFIAYMQSADGQCGIVKSTGLFPVNPAVVNSCLTAEEKKRYRINDLQFMNSLEMLEQPARLDKYLETWNAVKAAP